MVILPCSGLSHLLASIPPNPTPPTTHHPRFASHTLQLTLTSWDWGSSLLVKVFSGTRPCSPLTEELGSSKQPPLVQNKRLPHFGAALSLWFTIGTAPSSDSRSLHWQGWGRGRVDSRSVFAVSKESLAPLARGCQVLFFNLDILKSLLLRTPFYLFCAAVREESLQTAAGKEKLSLRKDPPFP